MDHSGRRAGDRRNGCRVHDRRPRRDGDRHPIRTLGTGGADTRPGPSVKRGTGLVAKPASSAFPMEARDIRLVRIDDGDLALQFELYNGTKQPVEPYDVGLG